MDVLVVIVVLSCIGFTVGMVVGGIIVGYWRKM